MNDIEKVICIKEIYDFKLGQQYNYWTNFGGLNHIVAVDSGSNYQNIAPFRGEPTPDDNYIWDYFMPINEWRAKQIKELGV